VTRRVNLIKKTAWRTPGRPSTQEHSSLIPTTNRPDQPTSTMPVAYLPPEIQDEILFQIVLANSDRDDSEFRRITIARPVLLFDISPYLIASRSARECWRVSWRVILHRVATVKLAATEAHRRRLSRTYVLARLRILVWTAARRGAGLQRSLSIGEKWLIACSAERVAWNDFYDAKKHACYWRLFLSWD
jgi:hypothetical protein